MLCLHYSLDNKSAGRQSVASNMTKPDPEDDADSMAEYGEGDTGKPTIFHSADDSKENHKKIKIHQFNCVLTLEQSRVFFRFRFFSMSSFFFLFCRFYMQKDNFSSTF